MTEQADLFNALPVYPGLVSRHPAYGVWHGIKDRCHNPKSKDFANYGGRGIFVCEEWRVSSRAFVSWAQSNGYCSGLQIDRKDNNGPYAPGNCRWVTPRVNMANRRLTLKLADGTPMSDALLQTGRTKYLYRRLKAGMSPDQALAAPVTDKFSGRRFLSDGTPLPDAILRAGVNATTVRGRIACGMTPDDAVLRPVRSRKSRLLADGTPVLQAARQAGLSVSMVQMRIHRGWSPDDAVSVPKGGKRPIPSTQGRQL